MTAGGASSSAGRLRRLNDMARTQPNDSPAAPDGPPVPPIDSSPAADDSSAPMHDSRRGMLDWAAVAPGDPALVAADWLAEDIAPGCGGALRLLTDPTASVAALRGAKDAFKTMRIMGEHPTDRRLGARLYLASIAAALAFHGQRISAQGDEKLARALERARDDDDEPGPLRHLAIVALRRLAK